MKRLLYAGLFVVFGFICFVTSPLVTAWFIRDAVKSGDTRLLESQVDWVPVRATLKTSMSELMIKPKDTRRAGLGQLWGQVKSYFKRRAIHSAVDRYAQPRSLPKLFQYARSTRGKMLGVRDPDQGASLLRRIQNFWARVKRAEFKSFTRFEMDLIDKYDRRRFYCGVLELRGFRWVLTELYVRRAR